MVEYENDCVGCGFPCRSDCRYLHVAHCYCDKCGEEETLYEFDGEQLCADCVLESLRKVDVECSTAS